MSTTRPVPLPANQPERAYRGGPGIFEFRGVPLVEGNFPEDFVASTTEVFGGGAGLTVLPDGRTLRDAVEADPVGWLGEAHVEAFGANPELLVKLLDTRQRLFVHFHPEDAFAREHLSSADGKTEAWIILAVEGESGTAHVGFSRAVTRDEVDAWIDAQDIDAMLAAMNRVELRAGTVIFVPAGVVHSIGSGVTLLELQQPTDLSVLLEYRGFAGLDESSAFLGIPRDLALEALDQSDASAALPTLVGELPSGASGGLRSIFPSDENFFRAEWITTDASTGLDAGFSVLVVAEGHGALDFTGGSVELTRGMTVLVPYAAGATTIRGPLSVVRCRPPLPRAAG